MGSFESQKSKYYIALFSCNKKASSQRTDTIDPIFLLANETTQCSHHRCIQLFLVKQQLCIYFALLFPYLSNLLCRKASLIPSHFQAGVSASSPKHFMRKKAAMLWEPFNSRISQGGKVFYMGFNLDPGSDFRGVHLAVATEPRRPFSLREEIAFSAPPLPTTTTSTSAPPSTKSSTVYRFPRFKRVPPTVSKMGLLDMMLSKLLRRGEIFCTTFKDGWGKNDGGKH